jgi:transposase
MSEDLQGNNLHNEIVRRHYSGSSMRSIARSLGISRYQVRRILAAYREGREQGTNPLPEPKKTRASRLDEYQPQMQQLIERYPDITAVRMHEELQKLGFTGSYSIVKRRLRQLRPRKSRDFVQRFETGPGLQGQMDYSTYTIDFAGEGRRRVHLFSYLLGYSRRQYLHFVDSQDFTTTIRQHVAAFQYLGGVAATCLYDNMKVVVTGYDGEEPVYNTRFLAFATHYGYRPLACRPRRSQTKGKVERPFYYVEKNLLNARTFQSLEHLNDVTATWLKEVADVRIHRETKQRPVDRFAEEASHLIPLPAHPYDTAEVVYRCVSAEGLIAYGQNRYSVPWRHIGLTLPVRVTETELIIYGPQIEEVARHPLFSRHLTGQAIRLKLHQPSDDSEKKYEVLKTRYDELGEAASRFFAELVKRRRYGKAEAHKILALLETYHRHDLLAAIERAVRYGAYSQSAIERILAVTATPKTALDRLAEKEQKQLDALFKDPSVQPRSGKEYQQMFDDPSDNRTDNETDNDNDNRTENPDDEPTDSLDEESPESGEDSESP